MTSPSKLKGTKQSANKNNSMMTVVGESNNSSRQLSSSSIRLLLILSAIILFGISSMIYTHSKLIKNDGDRMAAVADTSLQSFAPPTRKKFSLLDRRRQQKELQRWPTNNNASATVREKITTRELLQRAQQQQQSKQQSVISDERQTQKANGMHICTCLNTQQTQPSKLPSKPKKIRWLHIPKTGTSFISTLWSYTSSTTNRYIDLNVNSHSCSMFDNTSYSMYDFVLMKRYPWEMYGALNMIPNNTKLSVDIPLGLVGGTQHAALAHDLKNDESYINTPHYQRVKHSKMIRKWGSEISNNITIASFFRQPEDRILSAYYDGRHSNGFTPEIYKGLVDASYQRNPTTKQHSCTIDNSNKTYHNPLECFARYPGIAGCMTRMLSGETCADGILQENGIENLQMALDVILNHLDFVGLMEEWNESICQFHRLFGGKKKNDSSGTLYWDRPLQGEFSNVHKSTKQKTFTTKHLNGFEDHADRAVYEAVKYKFNQMVGTNKCHRYMTWDELRNDKEGIVERQGIKLDGDGNICKPKSCVELGKQCGEWSDGCGKTIICGMCNVGRTGLPSTWRVQCSEEGQCIDYCSPWKQKGYWFLSDDSPPAMKEVITVINKPTDQSYLTPVDAILICDKACNNGSSSSFQHFIDTGLCKCGTTPTILSKNFTFQDFSKAHDLTTMCGTNKVRNGAYLLENETQPICCPPGLTQKSALTKELKGKGWVRLFSMGSFNKEGEYFDHVRIECGAFQECEAVAREKKAEMAVFDLFNSMCYLARNVIDLKDWYTVTKDNQYRYAIDLRQG